MKSFFAVFLAILVLDAFLIDTACDWSTVTYFKEQPILSEETQTLRQERYVLAVEWNNLRKEAWTLSEKIEVLQNEARTLSEIMKMLHVVNAPVILQQWLKAWYEAKTSELNAKEAQYEPMAAMRDAKLEEWERAAVKTETKI